MGNIWTYAGWWFVTCFIFHILGISSSQLTNSIIFQRGRPTTNQNAQGFRSLKKNPFETPPPAQLAKSWMATRNPAPAESGAKHSIILDGFQPSVWWCRISQPSTVLYTVLLISQIGKFDPFLFTDYYNSYFKNAGYNMV